MEVPEEGRSNIVHARKGKPADENSDCIGRLADAAGGTGSAKFRIAGHFVDAGDVLSKSDSTAKNDKKITDRRRKANGYIVKRHRPRRNRLTLIMWHQLQRT